MKGKIKNIILKALLLPIIFVLNISWEIYVILTKK